MKEATVSLALSIALFSTAAYAQSLNIVAEASPEKILPGLPFIVYLGGPQFGAVGRLAAKVPRLAQTAGCHVLATGTFGLR
jgi:hypothetical protein